jgi:hypothetical protein
MTVLHLIVVDQGHLPFRPEFGWPRSNARWPSGSKIDQIKATGIHEVATDPFYWKLSFVSCEKQLIKEMDVNGTCRKKTQRIMKKFRQPSSIDKLSNLWSIDSFTDQLLKSSLNFYWY